VGNFHSALDTWDVNDKATAELMVLFYKAMLQDGQRPASAPAVGPDFHAPAKTVELTLLLGCFYPSWRMALISIHKSLGGLIFKLGRTQSRMHKCLLCMGDFSSFSI